jgi:hypothetical protein
MEKEKSMKAWAWMAVVPILSSLAHAESLGDVAQREHERRAKTRDVPRATLIREEELVAGPGKASRGTFNPAVGPAIIRPKADVAPPAASSTANGGGARTEVDNRRAAARDRLEASYEMIRDTAWSLMQAIAQYEQCRGPVIPANKSCEAQLFHIGFLALSVAARMEDAEDAARQGWLTPGDVRDARRRHGMDDSFWDALVRAVAQYRYRR